MISDSGKIAEALYGKIAALKPVELELQVN
jgi:hypothetical protein